MIQLVALFVGMSSAVLAGAVVLMLRRWRNDVLFRHEQPGYKDVAMPRAAVVVVAIVGSALGLFARQLGTTIICASSPAVLWVAVSAVSVFRQSRTRFP